MKSATTAVALLIALAMAGCAPRTPTPQSRATAAQQAACRQRADTQFLLQNPGTVYQSDAFVSGTRSAPFSGSGISGNIATGLPDRYTREQFYENCLNGLAPAPAPSPTGRLGPPAPPPPESPP